jgi:hypothetical protein
VLCQSEQWVACLVVSFLEWMTRCFTFPGIKLQASEDEKQSQWHVDWHIEETTTKLSNGSSFLLFFSIEAD